MRSSKFVVVALLAAVLGALFTVVYARRSSNVLLTPSGEAIFVYQLPEEEQGDDLVIQCNEKKFEKAFEEFRKFLKVRGEPYSVPGGPMALALPVDTPAALEPAKRAAIQILKAHSPRRVILLGHSECLLYNTVAAWQDKLAEVKERQETDLKRAREVVRSWFPNTEVQVFYADKVGGEMRFVPISK